MMTGFFCLEHLKMKTQANRFVNCALLGTLLVLFGTQSQSQVQSQTTAAVQDIAAPELVTIAPGTHMHRISGEFLKGGKPVEAKLWRTCP